LVSLLLAECVVALPFLFDVVAPVGFEVSVGDQGPEFEDGCGADQ